MGRYKLTLEYEGTKYSGWQYQKDQQTVQGKLLEVCRKVFETNKIELYGAGRTDSGVHALAQVAHLDVYTQLKPHQIQFKINDLLPVDINLLRVEKAAADFHARHDAIARSYVYVISKRRTAFGKKYVWWIKDSLNVPKMKHCSKIFEGLKDFISFGQQNADNPSTKVQVNLVQVIEQGDQIVIHIVGSHFLWKMVRRLVGVLAEVGRGKLSIEEVEDFFRKPSGKPAELTAPPSGLYLERIYYPGDKISEEFRTFTNLSSD